MVFQLTPGTEAPAEMNFHFPDQRVLCMAENATHTMHNIVTLRGALVRDPHAGPHYLNESIELFGARRRRPLRRPPLAAAGAANVVEYLHKQRDLYGYLHDQTLRQINQGQTGRRDRRNRAAADLAARVALPRLLRLCQPQREGGLPALHGLVRRQPRPPPRAPAGRVGAALRRVHGGAEAVVERARELRRGDYRWVAQVVNHVVFADPSNRAARELQADALEQLGYGAENATWRNFYLMGAQELREGIAGTPTDRAAADILARLGSSRSSTRWRSGSTARAPGIVHLPSTGRVTDPDEQPLCSKSRTASSTTAPTAPTRGRRDPHRRAPGAERDAAAKPPSSAELADKRPAAGRGGRRQARRAARTA